LKKPFVQIDWCARPRVTAHVCKETQKSHQKRGKFQACSKCIKLVLRNTRWGQRWGAP
jgi:hypothetical protein